MAEGPHIFDRFLLRVRERRAAKLGRSEFLLERVADDMAERLSVMLRKFENGVDLGTPSNLLRAALAGKQALEAVEIPEDEALPLPPQSRDLVVSALALHAVNDLPGVLVQVRRALKPDGLFLAALFGGETLTELRQAFTEAESVVEGGISPRVSPFADVRELGGLLQRAGFALPVTDVDRVTVRYDSVIALMLDLRRMGATNVMTERRKTPLRRETLAQVTEVYRERFADPDGRLRATFEIVWLSGWAPHESQQQPLKPGSAQRRLADALGTKEIPSGEKPN